MFSRLVLIPYRFGSDSCKKLQETLKELINRPVVRLKDNAIHKVKDKDLVIFWGNRDSVAANKLKFFKAASEQAGLNIPEWTEDREVAVSWYLSNKHFFARTKLTSHSGNGIVSYESKPTDYEKFAGDVVDAPLYVRYKKKSHEYRAHVFNGTVIDIVQKKRRAGWETINNQIRNLNGGWVYCREDLDIANRNELISQALLACSVCKLDFGAVDIIYNSHERKYYVLEVNTAPGLEGQTTLKYATAIKSFMEEQHG